MTIDDIFRKKASSTRIFQINLRKFFPPEDDYATCMARLCILREDLWVDIIGILEGPLERLDANGIEWRRLYFFRNYLKTLQEIASALHTLNCIPEFKRAFEKHYSPSEQKTFKDFCKKIQGSGDLITEIRNSAGGHIQHNVVAGALKAISPDFTGFWERPFDPEERWSHTHHPYVTDLVAAIFLAGDRDAEEALAIPGVMASLQVVTLHIDSLFHLYVAERQLL